MASRAAIADALKFLIGCYPSARVSVETAEAWYDALPHVPDATLRRAVVDLARNSRQTFFPAVSEVLALAHEIGGVLHEEAWTLRRHELIAKRHELEAVFWTTYEFDAAQWESLSHEFDEVGAIHAADWCRKKIEILGKMAEEGHDG